MQIKAPSVFDWEHGIALDAMQRNRASSLGKGGSLMVFFELRLEPRVYSRVTAGMAFQNSCLFSNFRTPV